LTAWSEERGVRLEFIQPGKPVQNAYVESFNGRFRDECLNANWFTSLSDARRKIETWRQDYNQQRPHSSLNYISPAEFARTQAEMSAGGKLVHCCWSGECKRRSLLQNSSPLDHERSTYIGIFTANGGSSPGVR